MRGGVFCSGRGALYFKPDLIREHARPVRAVFKFVVPIVLLAASLARAGYLRSTRPAVQPARGRAGVDGARLEFDRRWLVGLTVQLVDHISIEVSIVGFWKNAVAQQVLRGQIFIFLDDHEVVSFERADAVADRLMELAKANHARLVVA
jgi:hypothetical protein